MIHNFKVGDLVVHKIYKKKSIPRLNDIKTIGLVIRDNKDKKFLVVTWVKNELGDESLESIFTYSMVNELLQRIA
jgi:hypothetical protein